MDLPDRIPLFPLPNVVHFPGVPLPLHVFEERYRAMVRDALAGPRLIGMILLRAGWEDGYYGAPPVFEVGTAGEIVRADPLGDGRWNIVLHGTREFSIVEEAEPAPYRTARVAWRAASGAPVPDLVADRVWELVREYLAASGRAIPLPERRDAATEPRTVVNFFAQHLDLPMLERQALLEEPDDATRGARLVRALVFHLEAIRGPGGSGSPTLQ